MRFLRGLAICIGGFFLWIIASILGAFSVIADYGFDAEPSFDLLLESNPLVGIMLVLGFLLIFIGPLYYWIIEPLMNKNPSPTTYVNPPYQHNVAQNVPLPAKRQFCPKCGSINTHSGSFCLECGAQLVLR